MKRNMWLPVFSLFLAVVLTESVYAYSIAGWGNNYHGQATPPTGNDFVAIASGDSHSLALRANGSIVGWGYNLGGRATPPAGNDFVAISAGGEYSIALKADGSIVGWGRTTHPTGNDFVAIAAGATHSLALRANGSIVGWGGNSYGQSIPPAGNDFIAIAAGYCLSLALKTDGSLLAWGRGMTGGDSWATPPVGNDFVAISAGYNHSIALKEDGSIVAWGLDVGGTTTPPAGNDFIAVAAGGGYNLALKADGSIVGWGYNTDGRATPPAGNDFVAISAGGAHGLALTGGSPCDFEISDVNVVQVVWKSDIDGDDVNDLVAGKKTIVMVSINMEDYEDLSKDEEIRIQLDFCGIPSLEGFLTIEELEQINRIVFPPLIPTALGNQKIVVRVDPVNTSIVDRDLTNNEKTVNVTVKDTRGLYLVYFPVDGIDPAGRTPGVPRLGYGPINMSDYSDTVTNSGVFIEATYPVAGNELTNDEQLSKFYGSPRSGKGGIRQDLKALYKRGQLTYKSLDIAVGIAPKNYFDYHGEPDSAGFVNAGVKAVIVKNNKWTTAAHEIGEYYGLIDQWQMIPPFYTGPPTYGYWVSNDMEISNGICLMGPAGALRSFEYREPPAAPKPIWICDSDYAQLFRNFISISKKTGKSTGLLLSGNIYKDGLVELDNLYLLENCIIDDIMPGDYSIQILDADDQILIDVPFDPSFELHLDPGGTIDTDSAPIAFVIEYPQNAVKIKILYNGQTLAEINTNIKLLHDAIDSVPDYGFAANPEQLRKALHNKIDEIETKIKNGEIRDATNKLRLDLRKMLEKWLLDGYQKENPEQFSKEEAIELVDNMFSRFSTIWPKIVTKTKIAKAESDIDKPAFEWIMPEVFIEDIDENLKPTDNTGVEDAFDVKETIGFMLFEACEIIGELQPQSFANEGSAIELATEIDFIFTILDEGMYFESLILLENDILPRTDGVFNTGEPDEDDWVTSIEGQVLLYPLLTDTIEMLESML